MALPSQPKEPRTGLPLTEILNHAGSRCNYINIMKMPDGRYRASVYDFRKNRWLKTFGTTPEQSISEMLNAIAK